MLIPYKKPNNFVNTSSEARHASSGSKKKLVYFPWMIIINIVKRI